MILVASPPQHFFLRSPSPKELPTILCSRSASLSSSRIQQLLFHNALFAMTRFSFGLIVFFSFSISSSVRIVPRSIARKIESGITGERCTNDSECLSPRTCRSASTNEVCTGEVACFCATGELISCQYSDDCTTNGEVCVLSTPDGSARHCFSWAFAKNHSLLTMPMTSTSRLTYDSCTVSAECLTNRQCVAFSSFRTCTSDETDCICFPASSSQCSSAADCPTEGESCIDVPVNETIAIAGKKYCGSVAVAENLDWPVVTAVEPTLLPSSELSPSSEPSPAPCIAVHSLEGFGMEELRYAQHRRAGVLCDDERNCATPGHMVVFKGKGMMMMKYCEIVQCHKRVMNVNSPRWQRQLRIASSKDDLQFTAFAAKYVTRTEERFLSSLLHVGL